jgi:hypothetical protein
LVAERLIKATALHHAIAARFTRSFAMFSRIRSLTAAAGLLAFAAAGLTVSGAAQARGDVGFSIGLSAPGVGVVVGNGQGYYAPQPVYVQPQPVYNQPVYNQPVYTHPQPIYYAPQPVYVQPRPVYIQAPPVYVAPRPIYVQPGYGHRHGGPRHDRGYGRGDGRGDGHGYGHGYDRGHDRDWRR